MRSRLTIGGIGVGVSGVAIIVRAPQFCGRPIIILTHWCATRVATASNFFIIHRYLRRVQQTDYGANVITTDNSDWATNCPEYKVTAVQVSKVTQPSRWQARQKRFDKRQQRFLREARV